MNILVTGAFGFIGSNFVKMFKDKHPDAKIDVSDYLTNGKQIKNLHVSDYHQFLTPDDAAIFVSLYDHVFHFGAESSTQEWNGELVMQRNLKYSRDLISTCLAHGVPITYMSSASVYGNGNGPLNLYATSKYLVDRYVEELPINTFSTTVRGYRLFNVYAEDGSEWHKGEQASVIHSFREQAKETGVIKMFEGSSEFRRDFIDVESVCRIIIENMDGPSGIFDLGSGYDVSFETIAQVIAFEENARVDVIPFPESLRPYYQTNTKANMDWMKNEN